jgi:aminoglycoside phosphotransferase (APT) family kinase protein
MSRSSIYYWKCDRPAVLHGTAGRPDDLESAAALAKAALSRALGASNVILTPFPSHGNHLTWVADVDGQRAFLRVENGPEKDRHLEVESALTTRVAKTGVPVPRIIAVDASRSEVPFAWQAIEYFECPDLNTHFKAGRLQAKNIAREIGAAVATWQSVPAEGFGIFETVAGGDATPAKAYHTDYESYYRLRLEEHLQYLADKQFLSAAEANRMERAIDSHSALLQVSSGCFVHKDLALWNVLGSPAAVEAFIDFDDAISGDPLDDLSLLACFHNAPFLEDAIQGYQTVRPLPEDHRRRLWLHLLRNMIVKSVIRIGAGYFERGRDLFLVGNNAGGRELEVFTKKRLLTATSGLEANSDIDIL